MFGFLDNLKKNPSIFGSRTGSSPPSSSFLTTTTSASAPSSASTNTTSTTTSTSSSSSAAAVSVSSVSLDAPCPLSASALSSLIHTHLSLADSVALQFMAHLECAMCSAIMWSPVKTPCLHMFCHDCVAPWVDKSGTCPTCRKEVTTASLVRLEQAGDMLWQTFLTLQVRCVTEESEDGCKWKGNYSDLVSHLQLHCASAPVACPADPSHHFPRKQWPTHKESCEALPAPCPHCGSPLPRSDLSAHIQDRCALFPVACPNGCMKDDPSAVMPRGEVGVHRLTCPNEPVDCPLGDGCPTGGELTRASLAVHLSDPRGAHMCRLFGLVQDLSQQVAHLTTELDVERRNRKNERPYAARVWFCDVGAWVKPSASSQMPNSMVGVIAGPGRNEGWVRVNWVDGPQNDGCRVGGGDSQLVYTTAPDALNAAPRVSVSSSVNSSGLPASVSSKSIHLQVSDHLLD